MTCNKTKSKLTILRKEKTKMTSLMLPTQEYFHRGRSILPIAQRLRKISAVNPKIRRLPCSH